MFPIFAYMNKEIRNQKIELLSPARSKEYGIEAINHGADAVYIGAPRFGARVAAFNSLDDIAQLVRYAHRYGAKVHVALNTILDDHELEEAEKMIQQLYESEIDALIIQDLGILTLDIPPIELHASTQMDNRDIQKIHFLENLRFSRAILARELSIEEIRTIRSQSHLDLEAFVHGALCVSYSGQCYVSHAFTGRSANKGSCAQLCRLPYTLKEQNGKPIVQDQYLLSLKDMDRSSCLEELIDAGITSLKIEGRLKDISYVKNITSYYRKKLDAIFENRVDFTPASFGKTTLFFEPQPEKTFHRDKTEYFLHQRETVITEINTPKSIGEKVGVVIETGYNHLVYRGIPLQNGDGVIFENKYGKVEGFRINKVINDKLYPAQMPQLEPPVTLFRNLNYTFEKTLEKKSAERKISIRFQWDETDSGFSILVEDERGCSIHQHLDIEKEFSRQDNSTKDQIHNILSKTGNTIYQVTQIDVSLSHNYFIPASIITGIRRTLIEQLDQKWEDTFRNMPKVKPAIEKNNMMIKESLDYLSNVMNESSKKVYFNLGALSVADAFEKREPERNILLMQCKHCIKYSLGYCPKIHKISTSFKEPLILEHQKIKLELRFDCQACVMLVYRLVPKR